MSRDELRFAEAVASLTARLETWGVEEPHDKAHQYVADMRRQGWRPSGPRVVDLPTTGAVTPPTDEYRQARLSCRMTDHDPRRQKPDAGAETEAATTEESADE